MQVGEYPLITEEIGIPFLITGIGKTDYQCVINRPEGFPAHQMLYTWHGKGKISYNGGEYIEVGEGDLFFFSANVQHKYEKVSDLWSVSWVTFVGEHVEENIRRLGLNDGKVVHFADLHPIERLFDKMVRILRTKERYAIYSCSPLVYEMMMEVYKRK